MIMFKIELYFFSFFFLNLATNYFAPKFSYIGSFYDLLGGIFIK